ncbi:hypothetical protein R1flu_022130 [Riccia fluitans]|uniref:Uncharacterized protein n=1 Tax=Riccia fluitans TaxID=41844 RepID=A0ABD1ZRD3_9MARC
MKVNSSQGPLVVARRRFAFIGKAVISVRQWEQRAIASGSEPFASTGEASKTTKLVAIASPPMAKTSPMEEKSRKGRDR